VVIDREVVYSGMTDWRLFGRVPDFSAKIKDVIAQRRDRRQCVKDSCMGLFAIGLGLCHENWTTDDPTTLGIGGIGRDMVSEGVSQLRLG
jgi:hypothetical protein